MPTIVTKNSATAATAPAALQLTQGELAVNVTDRILYTKNAEGNVVTLGRPLNLQETAVAGTSTVWTKPAQATICFVEVLGAGGGGGGGNNHATTGVGGSGGGGGCYNSIWIDADLLGATETMTVGAGGTAGTPNGDGGAGGARSGQHTRNPRGSALRAGNVRRRHAPGRQANALALPLRPLPGPSPPTHGWRLRTTCGAPGR